MAWFSCVLRDTNTGRAVLIGADCPILKPGDIQMAFELLAGHDVVLGPAADGGYYLIGISGPPRTSHHHLFQDISWGSEEVLEITRQRVAESGLSLGLLEEKSDIDHITDLNRLREQLRITRLVDQDDADLADAISQLLGQANLESMQ